MIEAHADEISWYVNYISDDGMIYVIRNGGSDQMIAPSKTVHIHGEKGIVKGVFGWPAIHTRSANPHEPVPKIENIFIDCGCISKEEVEKLGIYVGCMITYPDEFFELNGSEGIFVLGNSSFPTGSHSHPTLLAVLLAKIFCRDTLGFRIN